MITTASLKAQTSRELGELAKKKRIAGWHSMRKDELVKAIMSDERKRKRKKSSAKTVASTAPKRKSSIRSSTTANGSASGRSKSKPVAKATATNGASRKTTGTKAVKATPVRAKSSTRTTIVKASSGNGAIGRNGAATRNGSAAAKNGKHKSNGHAKSDSNGAAKPAQVVRAASSVRSSKTKEAKSKPTNTSPRVLKRIHNAQANRERLRDLTTSVKHGSKVPTKDRIVLIVRDAFWLQAHWEITRATVERAQVALAEQWHTSRPVLRLIEIEDVSTTNTSERVVRDIEIHGEVSDWYIDVTTPATAYRVVIGYKAANDRFHVVARSNKVITPDPGSSDNIDENWTDIAENCEKIFAMSGGFDSDNSDGELRELFEERLRRPMGSPVVTKFGVGADGLLNRKRDFKFEVDAELIIYGATQPSAYVTLSGEPVRLRPDGTFTVRLSMPDRRQVLPVVASSADGVEQHTTVLAVERNTKVMEPFIKESSD